MATPNAPAPLIPNISKIRVVTSRTDTVTPEIGLFEEPNSAAIYPAIAEAINANNIANTAITAETAHSCDMNPYTIKIGMARTAIIRKTLLKFIS